MNIKLINNLSLFLFIFLVCSCKTIKNLSNDENFIINQKIENADKISLRENYNSNSLFLDFYSNGFTDQIIIDKNTSKKYTVNNYKEKYDINKPLKLYFIDEFLYGIDFKSNLNIYNSNDGKLINSISLNLNNINDISIPTSFSMYDKKFIIAYKSGTIIMIDKDGHILWEYRHDQLLSTPIKIYNNNVIALYGDTIKSISINDGEEIFSETYPYQDSQILNSEGGDLKEFANFLYFILPNSSVGEVDTFFNEKNYSVFTSVNYQNSINNTYDKLHVFDHYVGYFDDKINLYCYDVYLDEFILSKKRIPEVESFKFFNNTLIVKTVDVLKSYNLINGNLFWSLNIEDLVEKNSSIIKIESNSEDLFIFFNSGKVLIINNGQIINTVNLKVKDINLIYFQNNKIFTSLEKGKTILF